MQLRLSEVFESIQGEGASAGRPSVFVRLATCNLRCSFCDTPYTWDWTRHRYDDEVTVVGARALAARVRASEHRTVVVTGGEPLLQAEGLARLLEEIDRDEGGPLRWVEVETNGTIAPSGELVRRVDQWNVSPKLSNSAEPERRRLRAEPLRAFLGTGRAWLKLVVAGACDLEEAEAVVARHGWPRDRVLLMPEAATREALLERTPAVRKACEELGYGFSPRLHVELWGGERGR